MAEKDRAGRQPEFAEGEDPCNVTSYGQPPMDLAQLESQLAQRPDDEDLLDLVAFAYYSSEHFVKAAATYEKLVRLNPSNPAYHFYLGNTHYRLGHRGEAFRAWKSAETVDETGKYAPKARERMKQLAHLPDPS